MPLFNPSPCFIFPKFLSAVRFPFVAFFIALSFVSVDSRAIAQTTGILQSVSCSKTSITGAGTDPCTISLKYAAEGSPLTVTVSSNIAALAVPATVTIPAGSSSGSFTATVAAVTASQTGTISVKAWNSPVTFSVQVSPAAQSQTVGTLNVNATSVSFGDVSVKGSATQTITVSAQGGPIQINSAAVSGTGFSIVATAFPIKLSSGQSTSLNLEFAPTATGNASGQLTISSNSGTKTIALSGVAVALTYQVDLSWNASSSSSVSGYNVYRAPSGSSSYQKLNSSLNQATSYTDLTVQAGSAYQYYVVSVSTSGTSSTPSNTTTISVP